MAAKELDSIIEGIKANKGAIMLKGMEGEAGETKWGNTYRGWEIYIGSGKRRRQHKERVGGGNWLGFRLMGHDLDRWIYVQRLQKVINM